ncbi:MAG: hypothetical protein RSA27_07830, partial [Oscillospiraceae bacterium]
YRASSKAIGLTQAKPLGTSPRLIDDSTYVPANLFNLLFTSETVSVKDGILHIDTLKKPIIKED